MSSPQRANSEIVKMLEEYKTPRDVIYAQHYMGNWLLNASLCLEEGDTAEAERVREELVQKLKQVPTQTDLIARCVDLVANSDWRSEQGVEATETAYNNFPEIRLNNEEMKRVRDRYFKS